MEKIVVELKQKNNILFISEFNKIISDAIANEPAPYIYERLGERYKHFLIDENTTYQSDWWLPLHQLHGRSLWKWSMANPVSLSSVTIALM